MSQGKRSTRPLWSTSRGVGCLLLLLAWGARTAEAQDKDISASYVWKPVRIGVGGYVVGMTLHPLDAEVRYARTDVGNAYRWDSSDQTWVAMRVANHDGSGIHDTAETFAPSAFGVDSIAVDPVDLNVVYMVFPTQHSCDVLCPSNYAQIYKSTDGGRNFEPGGLATAGIIGQPNGEHRQYGERQAIDPINSRVLYYGSDKQGLLRSLDSGVSWTRYQPGTGLPADIEIINIQFAQDSNPVRMGAIQVTRTIYAISMRNAGDAGGDVYRSEDGGTSWTDISAGVTDPTTGGDWAHTAPGIVIASQRK